MSYKNPYAKPNNPYSQSSSSSNSNAPYVPPSYSQPIAAPVAYPQYPPALTPVAGPSIPPQYDIEQNAAQQASIYTPEAAKGGGPQLNQPVGQAAKGKARTTVLRKGGGDVWEDQSLLEWDPGQFLSLSLPTLRLIIGV